jgi:HK97 family phage major capsid protein
MAATATDYIKSEQTRVMREANDLISKAEAEGRSLAPEEREKVQSILSKNAELQERVDEIAQNEEIRTAVESALGVVNAAPEQTPRAARTLGEAFTSSERFQTLKTAGVFAGSDWTTGMIETPFQFSRKATLDSSAADVVQPTLVPGIVEDRTQRPTVADLLSAGQTASSSIRYIQQNVNTSAAATVAEGAAKPEGTLGLTEVDEAVRKIAEVMTITDELLEDLPALRSFVDNQLRRHLLLVEEAQLLTGDGSAPNLRGLLRRSGLQTQALGSLTAPDAIYAAMTRIRNEFFEPDGIVIHPSNWAAVRLSKDQNNQYYAGGPFMGPYGVSGIFRDNIWGVNVVVTSSCPHDVALVGEFASATLFRRSGIAIGASNSHNDYFQKNLTMLRIEERIALAVPNPEAFCAVTGLAEIAS